MNLGGFGCQPDLEEEGNSSNSYWILQQAPFPMESSSMKLLYQPFHGIAPRTQPWCIAGPLGPHWHPIYTETVWATVYLSGQFLSRNGSISLWYPLISFLVTPAVPCLDIWNGLLGYNPTHTFPWVISNECIGTDFWIDMHRISKSLCRTSLVFEAMGKSQSYTYLFGSMAYWVQ